IHGLGPITYHWLRNGEDTGSTGGTYVRAEADVGSAITAQAAYTDGHGTAETVVSAATAAVANVNDAPNGAVTISGTATQGQTLTASNTIADADGLGAITYHWLRNGVDTGSTGGTYVLAEADVGGTITAQATYTDGHGTAETVASAATAAVANVNDAPTGSVSISGTATQGQTLTASNNILDADGLGTVTYQWLRDGVVTSLTGNTYALSQTDVGAQIRAVAIYTDGHGAAESMSSASSALVANVNDAPLLNAGSMLMSANPSVTLDVGTLLNTATDLDGDALTVQVMNTVVHGQLTVLGDGSLHYQAAAGFSGMDQFTYVAFDGQLQSGIRTVMISVTSPSVDEVIIFNPGAETSTPTTPSTPVDSSSEIDSSTPITPPTIDPIPDPGTVVTKPSADQGTGDQGDPSPLPPTGASSSSNGASGPGSGMLRYASASSFNGASQGQNFAFSLDLGGLDLSFNAGRAFMISINGMKPMDNASSGLNLSLNASSDHGGTHAASLHFAETPDEHLVKVQKVAVQTSGAIASVGAVWWAARMSGLLASLMISTPAWRSIDPLPVMGLSNGPEGDDDDAGDPLAPEAEGHMDEKAAGLFSAKAPTMTMARNLESIG
ncbi:Ig-like domain-containing protein, partial [Aquabacterium sp.]|uniref:Ig-like domain-containing protein n=1 Tax=Aquabacterium sp. TaxID=1872578 RepID=UPI0019A150F0